MSPRRRWRDHAKSTFADVVITAAAQLAVSPLAVEKDYWVCQELQDINEAHPDEIVFKGGTSLEKLRIIQRFSEDLDLLVIGKYASNRATQRALKQMIETAATSTLSTAIDVRSGGKPGSYHRSAYMSRNPHYASVESSALNTGTILVELGQAGGPSPHRKRPITSLIARQLQNAGFDTTEWVDLASFEVSVLHPGRTLIEKLLRINNFTQRPEAEHGEHGWPRIGRQFYDIWALLGNAEVLQFLQDRPLVHRIMTSCYEASQSFTPDLPVPVGGFAASPAFTGHGSLAVRLRAEHEIAMANLYYGTHPFPSFDQVLVRVHELGSLLDVSTQM